MSSNQKRCYVEDCNDFVFIRKHQLCFKHYNAYKHGRRTAVPIVCQWCHESFSVAKGYECLTKYCSKKCSAAAKRRVEKELETPELRQKRISYRYAWRLKQKGTTPEYVAEKFVSQNGLCAICQKSEDELKGGLCLDHNHETNRPRGLLCRNCNAAIGGLGDSAKRLRAAASYLEEYEDADILNVAARLEEFMKYTSASFTLPAGSSKISQEAWDRAMNNKKPRKSKKKGKK